MVFHRTKLTIASVFENIINRDQIVACLGDDRRREISLHEKACDECFRLSRLHLLHLLHMSI